MKLSLIPAVVCLSSFALVSCGGGGGSDDPEFTPDTPISITAQNSPEVVAEALVVASNFSTDVGPQLRPENVSDSLPFDLPRFLTKHKLTRHTRAARTANLTVSDDCTSGGSWSMDVNESFTSGSMTFNNCNEYGDTLNGKMSFSESGNVTTITFSDFSMTGVDYSFTATGSTRETYTSYETYEHYVYQDISMVVTMSSQGRTLTMGNYNEVFDDYWEYQVSDISFDVNSSSLDGSFSLDTSQALYYSNNQDYPNQGQVVITGASNSKVRVTSSGGDPASNVLVETDADGDGTYESSTSMTWYEIETAAALKQ
jgi:hypothetical protein